MAWVHTVSLVTITLCFKTQSYHFSRHPPCFIIPFILFPTCVTCRPKYKSWLINNDIVLIKLSEPATISQFVQSLALPRWYRDSIAQVWNCSTASHASDSAPLQLLIETSCSGWIFPSCLIRAVTIPTTAEQNHWGRVLRWRPGGKQGLLPGSVSLILQSSHSVCLQST